MLHSNVWLSGLAWLSLLACGSSLVKAANSASGVMEVDLIFPRNDTYDPIDNWPVIFAVQNFEMARSFDGFLHWDAWLDADDTHSNVFSWTMIDFKDLNSSRSGTQFLSETTRKLQGIEGTWRLRWSFSLRNCTVDMKDEDSMPQSIGFATHYRQIVFTTKKGAAQLDFAAYTESGACHDTDGIAYNVSETISRWGVDNICPIIPDTMPPPNPCAVEIDKETASNISFGLNHSGCFRDYASMDDCRRNIIGESLAGSQFSASSSLASFLAACFCLYYVFL